MLFIFGAGMVFNLVLFGVKLDVGLTVNSICIWSDAVNNLFDALSCLLSVVCMAAAQAAGRGGAKRVEMKTEHLLSFVLSVIVAAVGVSFAYSSLERFIYPTPVWFSMKYFFIVLATALAKLGMFFFYRHFALRTGSVVLQVVKTDSLLDFFVTLCTLLSFTLTQVVSFAVDAAVGLVISALILVQAVRLLVKSVRVLLDYVPHEQRKMTETLISACKAIEKIEKIQYYKEDAATVDAFVRVRFDAALPARDIHAAIAALQTQCLTQSGVRLQFILPDSDHKERSGRISAE